MPRRTSGVGRGVGAIAAVLLLAAASPAVRAGQGRWTPFGPGEAMLASFAATPRGDLYVTTAGAGLAEIWHRPAGASAFRWRNVGLGMPVVTALAVHPKDPNRLWVASGGGPQSVYRSTDGGGSWQSVSTGGADFQVVRLSVVPAHRGAVLLAETGAGAPPRLLRSADGGASWAAVPGVLGPVATAPDEPGVVYAAAAGGGRVLRSSDAGATFRPTGPAGVPAGDSLFALHATYGRGALLFASFATGGLRRSTDGGAHWQRVALGNDASPVGLASDPGNPALVVASAGSNVYASSRSGRPGTWTLLFSTFPRISFPARDVAVLAGAVYFRGGFDLYVYRPSQPERGFQRVDGKGIEAFAAGELHIHPADPPLFAVLAEFPCSAFLEGCVRTLLSSDGGMAFRRLGAALSAHTWLDVVDLAFDPLGPPLRLEVLGSFLSLQPEGGRLAPVGVRAAEFGAGGALMAGGFLGVQVSVDGGITWQTTLARELPATPEHPTGATREVIDLTANPYARDRVVALTLERISDGTGHLPARVVYRSADSGGTWTRGFGGVDDPLDIEPVPAAPESAYLLVATDAGVELRHSDDGGASSHLVHTFAAGMEVSDLAADPSAPANLYAATGTGVLRSRDAGASWEPTPGGFAPWGSYRRRVGRVWVHPTERGHLFAAPAFGGLFENQLPD